MQLTQIWIYPIKSLPGLSLREARLMPRGLENDRRFMVVDGKGHFLTQREVPAMAAIELSLETGVLSLRSGALSLQVSLDAEGPATEVVVWGERVSAIDVGEEAAKFFSGALHREARLVRMPDSTCRPVDRRYARMDDQVSFADGFPLLLVSESSLDDLKGRIGSGGDVRRFRPNVVVGASDSPLEPFVEDTWSGLRIGDVSFRAPKPCGRCEMVDVDPKSGERAAGVLATLAKYRRESASGAREIIFGRNLIHDDLGILRLGDPVSPAKVTL